MENNKNLKYGVIGFLSFLVLLGLDQGTKYLAETRLKGSAGVPLIPGVLEFQYLENAGAAWGILQNKQLFFYMLTVPFVIFLIWVFFRIPQKRRYLGLHIISIMLLAGAIGNLIDRLRLKYVIDFIYFKLINFPIFNVADIYVVISIALFFVLIMFFYKDEELHFLSRKKKEA